MYISINQSMYFKRRRYPRVLPHANYCTCKIQNIYQDCAANYWMDRHGTTQPKHMYRTYVPREYVLLKQVRKEMRRKKKRPKERKAKVAW